MRIDCPRGSEDWIVRGSFKVCDWCSKKLGAESITVWMMPTEIVTSPHHRAGACQVVGDFCGEACKREHDDMTRDLVEADAR